ncbi:MAG TPA: VTT domain-containing protein [Candidatus Stackebrandtia faecavium]|nr:VTT domain-containing protein [Candidatus Stackebrandtia faecavium]
MATFDSDLSPDPTRRSPSRIDWLLFGLKRCHTLCGVEEVILEIMRPLMTSTWIFVIIFGVAFLDAFFPVVPGETSVIIAGASAAAIGSPNIVMVIAIAAIGAFAGDHASYVIGRFGLRSAGRGIKSRLGRTSLARLAVRVRRRIFHSRLVRYMTRSKRTEQTNIFEWADASLNKRGAAILITARYIPGGRTAVTLTCGTVRFSLRRFAAFDAVATLLWGMYSGLIGYAAGWYFEGHPLLALGLGFVLAIVCSCLIEFVRGRFLKRVERRKEATRMMEPALDTAGSTRSEETAA